MKLIKAQWSSINQAQVTLRVDGIAFPDEYVHVNQQWLQDIESIFSNLIQDIRNNLHAYSNIKSIYFIGHGIGGAYALITGLLWHYEASKVMQKNLWPEIGLDKIWSMILTFGAPKIGNSQLSALIDRTLLYLRVTHGNDYVPQFPDDSIKWKHSGAEIWLQPSENCECPEDFYSYWDCNNYSNQKEGTYETNMECNAGQSITKVSNGLFHNGPYFGVTMGDCKEYYS
ncbi:hypothetical protein G9A89_015075 [Geosiphon pyriformis]|nr:hypothetical protein G9A89_015075 [Geosiphon pyriformis]